MKTNQKGFTMTTMALLGFTIVVGIWFVLTHDMTAARNELESVINEMVSIFKR